LWFAPVVVVSAAVENERPTIKGRAKDFLSNSPTIYKTVSAAYRYLNVLQGLSYVARQAPNLMMGARPIVVGYSSVPRPRWGYGLPGHARLHALIDQNRSRYKELIGAFGGQRAALEAIPDASPAEGPEPSWNNSFFSGLDAVALYGLMALHKPRRYFEIGSGFSTRLARRAVRDLSLPTTVLSIDPSPQSAIDALCDTVIRQPLEDVNVEVFDQLEAGDILFFDGSHYAFTNSDVVVLWMDILPRLKPGVLVQIHDIFLPYDYPPGWLDRYYSEQYLLAVALLNPAVAMEVVFPVAFVGEDPELSALVDQTIGPRGAGSGASFWLKTGAPQAR
jgi:hypothetical protein